MIMMEESTPHFSNLGKPEIKSFDCCDLTTPFKILGFPTTSPTQLSKFPAKSCINYVLVSDGHDHVKV
ncbi:hypothetical protein VCRA2133E348_250034 [Vibrio crassostreae]|nr:hypothetical protein VCRA2119O48_220034 [Vibrio crassostreae]CAK2806832.1 hypothetical protein VCRA2133E348_250034 [Vibrio crassostreae]CAK3289749.1 hypothetical protein VCRA213O314_240060 [Vibrio crassostreae]CAK3848444.1 hypothetical protein VCRA212O16_230035 [Vibrio crassostreae]